MNALLRKIVTMGKQLGFYALQYFFIALAWAMRILKVQMQKWGEWNARKQMAKANSALGAEVYALYKQGQTGDLQNMPSIQQQLKLVEEEEAKVLKVEEIVDGIIKDYLDKKDLLKEKYHQKRADAASKPTEQE